MASADILILVGAAIRRHRQANGLSLHELALLSGLSGSALSLIETGKRDARLSTLAKIAHALNIEIAALFAASDDAESPRDESDQPGYDLSAFE